MVPAFAGMTILMIIDDLEEAKKLKLKAQNHNVKIKMKTAKN